MASLQAELQEVKRKREVAVTSLEAKVTASSPHHPTSSPCCTQVVSREAELQVQSKALQVSGLLGIVMCTVDPLHKYLPSPFPSPLPAMFSDDHARHAT